MFILSFAKFVNEIFEIKFDEMKVSLNILIILCLFSISRAQRGNIIEGTYFDCKI